MKWQWSIFTIAMVVDYAWEYVHWVLSQWSLQIETGINVLCGALASFLLE
jgi:hypothetical protein